MSRRITRRNHRMFLLSLRQAISNTLPGAGSINKPRKYLQLPEAFYDGKLTLVYPQQKNRGVFLKTLPINTYPSREYLPARRLSLVIQLTYVGKLQQQSRTCVNVAQPSYSPSATLYRLNTTLF